MSGIIATMTVREAAEYLSESSRKHLQRWGETFVVPLNEFHIGHIRTYQIDRAQEVEAAIVDREVAVLLMLLRELDLSTEIERFYTPLLLEPARVKAKKPDDGRCLYREPFVKKNGTLAKIKRQCSRQAEMHDGHFMQFCSEHQREVNETFLRVMNREKPRVTFVKGPRTVQ